MNITSTYKLYFLGQTDEFALLVFLDSKDEFLYCVRPISEKRKILDFRFGKDCVYGVTYNPESASKENPRLHMLIKVFDPVKNKELSF